MIGELGEDVETELTRFVPTVTPADAADQPGMVRVYRVQSPGKTSPAFLAAPGQIPVRFNCVEYQAAGRADRDFVANLEMLEIRQNVLRTGDTARYPRFSNIS